jgi:hypothetical protein
MWGRGIAQAANRRLPTAAAPGSSPGLVDKVVLGQVFSEYFGFPCQSSFHRSLHNHHHHHHHHHHHLRLAK